MRAGILIVGSLLWEPGARAAWRQSRLRESDAIQVTAPIRYGRKSTSRGNTYTMVIDPGTSSGSAVLVPCQAEVAHVQDLLAEAEALWKAEQPSAVVGDLGAAWGCVGACFYDERCDVAIEWRKRLRGATQAVHPVDQSGILRIAWPLLVREGASIPVDVILATATKAQRTPPTAIEIADAFIAQHGSHERYFFENVRNGIRTADDHAIWERMREKSPTWINRQAYLAASEVLAGGG